MGYCWTRLEVYNHDWHLGSFYTNKERKGEWVKEIDEEFGRGKWTRYNVG